MIWTYKQLPGKCPTQSQPMAKRKAIWPTYQATKRTRFSQSPMPPFAARALARQYSRRPTRVMNRSFAVQNEWQPMGKSTVKKFKYATYGTINPSLGTPLSIRYRANGMFDPEVAIGGHQPYAFDQMMALFNHFTVVGAKITVRCCNNNSLPMFLCTTLRGDSVTATTTSELLEQPGTKSVLINIGDTAEIVHTFSAQDFFKRPTSVIVGAADYRGNVANDPAELAYFNVFVAPNNPNDDLQLETIHVLIEYTAHLTEPKTLSQS